MRGRGWGKGEGDKHVVNVRQHVRESAAPSFQQSAGVLRREREILASELSWRLEFRLKDRGRLWFE